MLPSPKLDDRKYEDILNEVIALIPRYCPEWTNHNPSDPGITLLELAAHMTEQILYRLNRVPEKNYVAFLNLLGIKLQPPRAARTLLQFALEEGSSAQKIAARTLAATPQSSDQEAVEFETARDVMIIPSAIDRCFSYYNETYSENRVSERVTPFEVFGGMQRVERFIYLSDPRFAGAGEESVLRVQLGCPDSGGRDLSRQLEWQFFDGDRWKELEIEPIDVERGEVCFAGPIAFAETEVNGIAGLWLRGRLAEVPQKPEHTEIDTVRSRVEVVGEGVLPNIALSNINDAFLELDLAKNTFLLGSEPRVDSVLYLSCEEVMQTVGAEVAVEFVLAEQSAYPRPKPSDDLSLVWEYSDGKRWRTIGSCTPRGVAPGAADEHGFVDTTKALAQSGTISFRRPADMGESDVGGHKGHWIRVRVERGDYGKQGSYTLDNEQWVFKNEKPLQPPVAAQINFRFREPYEACRHTLAFNDFLFKDVTEQARSEFTIFQPFGPHSEQSPAVYLGYPVQPPNDEISVYFDMTEELGLAASISDVDVVTAELTNYEQSQQASWEAEQRVVWEYYAGKSWQPLAVKDETKAFTTSGFVNYVAPPDWASTKKFTENRFWIRARLEMGGYVKSPQVRRLLSNCVYADNFRTFTNECIGGSDGGPAQTFELSRAPLLEEEVITVLEPRTPPKEELVKLGEDAIMRASEDETDERMWVQYKKVESFFQSGPRDRHYTIDYASGVVTFGDGRNGMIPPESTDGIVVRSYRVGGGAGGNVNANTVSSLKQSLAHVEGVTNPIEAAGGADRESLEGAKSRAPYTIKSRDRAVTAEDYEMLALRASTLLARARCVPDRTSRGAVTLVVLPKASDGDLTSRLVPSLEVTRYIKRYLDERRLVGSMLNVVRPRYRDLSIYVTLVRKTVGSADRLRAEIENNLRVFLHALSGGVDGQGWPFGDAVRRSELVRVVGEVPGVEGVDKLEIFDESRRVGVQHVRLEEDELPFLVNVRVSEKVHDEIR